MHFGKNNTEVIVCLVIVFLFFLLFLFWNNNSHRSCKNSTKKFPCILHPVSPDGYILCNLWLQKLEIDIGILCVYSCAILSHVYICVTTTTKIQNFSMTTKISLMLLLYSLVHCLLCALPPPSLTLETTNLLSTSIILSFRECCSNGTT